MEKLATLPFEIGKAYEIGQVVEIYNSIQPMSRGEEKVISQIFYVKNKHDLEKLNHHWEQLIASQAISGIKVLPPLDITEKVNKVTKISLSSKIKKVLRKDGVLSESKIEEYTDSIIKILRSEDDQLKLNI